MTATAQSNPTGSTRARYGEAVQLLEKDLRNRKYAVGDKLPTLRELSEAMGMNHRTVRRGIQELVQIGKLEVRHGVGVFVRDHESPAPLVSKKITRVALGCRRYMFSTEKHHPVISSYWVGAHRRFSTPDISLQSLVYKGYNIADEIGDAILAQEIDGFIVCTGGASPADIEFFAKHKIPLVHCGFAPIEHEWPISIVIDLGSIMRQAMDHLRQLGHRSISFVAWELTGDHGLIHRQFDRMVFDYQLGDVRNLHIMVPDGEEAQWVAIENFFDSKPFPSAVIVFDEFIADVLLAGCRRRGIRVPEDLSVVSLNDATPFGHSVPLTAPDSIRMNSEMMFTACDLIDKLLKGEPVSHRRINIRPELLGKASSAPVQMK